MVRENDHDVTNILLAFVFALTIIANGIQLIINKKFYWNSSVVSTKNTVAQISNCEFKGNYNINKNTIIKGWNKINVNENNTVNELLPDSLFIKWFSYNEQKFYCGRFALQKEIILDKIDLLNISSSIQGNNKEEYICFIAEIMPKGKLTVWLQKSNKVNSKLKIADYQSKEIKETWHIFDDYNKEDTSYINIKNKVALVLEKHSYKLDINLPTGYKLRNSYINLFTQDILHFDENDYKEIGNINSLPKKIYLTWNNGKKKFSTDFYFSEDEVLDVFRKLDINLNKEKTNLILELSVNDRNDSIKAVLKSIKTNSKVVLRNKYQSSYKKSIRQL